MKSAILIMLCLISTVAMAQTPFEFALVQELVQGSPRVSIIRITVNQGSPEPGRTELEIAVRGAVTFTGDISVYPNSNSEMCGIVNLTGQSEYSGEISTSLTDRLFDELLECLDDFPGMNITDLALDIVSPDGLSWLALECPLSRIDSLQSGQITASHFWQGVSLREIEIATHGFTSIYGIPAVPIETPLDTFPVAETVIHPQGSTQPWKSLVLPGWGQLSSGDGLGWINILVEAGGAALLISGEKNIGYAVLGVNHIISFFDLFR